MLENIHLILVSNASKYFTCLLAVCETTYEEVKITEQVPKCETEMVNHCFESPESDEKICKDVAKQVCSLEPVESVKHVPSTECKTMERPTTVCGPQHCPVTKSEPVCEDKMKMVSFCHLGTS